MREIRTWIISALFIVLPLNRAVAHQEAEQTETAQTEEVQTETAPQKNQDPVFEMWKAISPSFKVIWLTAKIAGYIGFTTTSGPQELDQIAQSYLAVGVGFVHDPVVKEGSDEGGRVGIRVVGVYIGSPADRAGVNPGDWLLSVNSVELCTVPYTEEEVATSEGFEATTKKVQDCDASAERVFEEASGDIIVAVERDGKTHTFQLVKETVGQELAAELAGKVEGWKRALADVASHLSALAERVKAAGENSAELDVCYLEFEKQKAVVSASQRELSDIQKRYIRTLPQSE